MSFAHINSNHIHRYSLAYSCSDLDFTFDHRGKENMYGVDVKSQRPPTGKTRYRFVLLHSFVIKKKNEKFTCITRRFEVPMTPLSSKV